MGKDKDPAALLEKAFSLLARDQYEGAEKLLLRLVNKVGNSSNPQDRLMAAKAYHMLTALYIETKDWKMARRMNTKMIALLQDTEEYAALMTGEAFHTALICRHDRDVEGGLNSLRRGVDIARKYYARDSTDYLSFLLILAELLVASTAILEGDTQDLLDEARALLEEAAPHVHNENELHLYKQFILARMMEYDARGQHEILLQSLSSELDWLLAHPAPTEEYLALLYSIIQPIFLEFGGNEKINEIYTFIHQNFFEQRHELDFEWGLFLANWGQTLATFGNFQLAEEKLVLAPIVQREIEPDHDFTLCLVERQYGEFLIMRGRIDEGLKILRDVVLRLDFADYDGTEFVATLVSLIITLQDNDLKAEADDYLEDLSYRFDLPEIEALAEAKKLIDQTRKARSELKDKKQLDVRPIKP